jgi:hypothetical protein
MREEIHSEVIIFLKRFQTHIFVHLYIYIFFLHFCDRYLEPLHI